MFIDITIFTYIIPVKWNVQIINVTHKNHWWTRRFSSVSQLTHKWTWGKQHPNNYHSYYKCTTGKRIKPPRVHRHHYFHLHNTCKVKCTNYKCYQISWKRFWTFHHKKPKRKNHYTTMVIILFFTKPTKHNKSNYNQTLQTI